MFSYNVLLSLFHSYRELHDTLIKHKKLTNKNQDVVIETLRNIAELMVFGDKHSEHFFEFFCTKNFLALFLTFCRQVFIFLLCCS